MKLLNNKERDSLELELSMILRVGYAPKDRPKDSERAMEIMEILDNSYHTNVDFELKLIEGGK